MGVRNGFWEYYYHPLDDSSNMDGEKRGWLEILRIGASPRTLGTRSKE